MFTMDLKSLIYIYEAQNFIYTTSVSLFSIIKGISEIYVLERGHNPLKSSKFSYIFIYIHSFCDV